MADKRKSGERRVHKYRQEQDRRNEMSEDKKEKIIEKWKAYESARQRYFRRLPTGKYYPQQMFDDMDNRIMDLHDRIGSLESLVIALARCNGEKGTD